MAFQGTSHVEPCVSSFPAGADLSAESNLWKIVKFDGSGAVVLAGDGERGFGVLSSLNTQGKSVDVIVDGGAKVKLSGTASEGNSVGIGAAGVAETPGAAEWCLGIFMEDGVDGDIVSILIDRHNSPA